MKKLLLTSFMFVIFSANAQLTNETTQDFSAKRADYQVEIDKQGSSINLLNNNYSIGLSNLKDIVHSMAYGRMSLDNSILYGASGRAFIIDGISSSGQYKGPQQMGVDACLQFNSQNSFYLETAPDVHVGLSSLAEVNTNASLVFDGNMLSLSPQVQAKYAVGPSIKIDLKNDASLRLSNFISLVGFGVEQSMAIKVKEPHIPTTLSPSNQTSLPLPTNSPGSIQVNNIQIELYTPKGDLVKRSVFKAGTNFNNTLTLKFQVDMEGYRQVSAGMGTVRNMDGTQDFNMNLEYKTPISETPKKPELKQF